MFYRQKVILLAALCFFSAMSCTQKPHGAEEKAPQGKGAAVEGAKVFAQMSEEYYQRAVENYQKAIQEGQDVGDARYKLALLYDVRGDYTKAIETLESVSSEEAQKLLAACLYKTTKYTDALALFEKLGKLADDEYLFYYASTCEKHNLHTKAIELYEMIQGEEFKPKAQERIQLIGALKEKTTVDGLDPKIQEMIASAPAQEDYPQAAAVVLYLKEDVEIKEDNTMEYTEHYLIKILNERGKNLGEVKVGYDSTYSKVEIDFARTIKPNGQVVSAGDKHIRDVSKYLNFPLYSNARVKIISMPEVAVGAVLEYKVRVYENKMVAEDKFKTSYFLQMEHPVKHCEFNISVPKDVTLKQKDLNKEFNTQQFNLAPTVSIQDNRKTYAWKFDNIQQIIPEPKMPPASEATPVMLLSNFDSWEEIHAWWWELAKDKIQVDENIRAKIKELITDTMTIRQKAQAIYTFCARDIRYVGIEYGQAGYEPHNATEIFSNKYGDCKDQAILLVSMLKEVGIKAYPVLIGTKGVPKLQEDFPDLLFNHCIAVAEIDGEYIFMDPTGETVLFGDLPAGDQGRLVFVCFENEGRLMTIPRNPAPSNAILKTTTLVFDEKEFITAKRIIKTLGIFDQMQRAWLRYTMPILVKETLQEKIQQMIPGSQLEDYKIDNLEEMKDSIVVSYNFSGSDFLVKAGNNMRIVPQLGEMDLDVVSKEKRIYPIDFNLLSIKEDKVEIKLPLHYQIVSLPDSVRSDNEWFFYENIYEKSKDSIIFSEKYYLKADRIEVKDYSAYKVLLEKLSKDIRQSVIIQKR